MLAKTKEGHTHGNLDRVPPLYQRLIIVPVVQLCKRRQPRRPHPILEMFVARQLRDVRAIVLRSVTEGPIGRRDDFAEVFVSRVIGILLRFARPCDALVREVINGGLVSEKKRLAERIYGLCLR